MAVEWFSEQGAKRQPSIAPGMEDRTPQMVLPELNAEGGVSKMSIPFGQEVLPVTTWGTTSTQGTHISQFFPPIFRD